MTPSDLEVAGSSRLVGRAAASSLGLVPTPLAALSRLQHLSTLVIIMDKDDATDSKNAQQALERYKRFLRDIRCACVCVGG